MNLAAARWRLRKQVDDGAQLLGGWCGMPGAMGAELMALAGFDWICVDTQHGLIGYDQMVAMLRALDVHRVPGVVRVAENDAALIGRALDAGAVGVIVPMVNTAAEAAAAAAACRYAPEGSRSWGPTRIGIADPDYRPENPRRKPLCIVMAESVEAVENIDDIAQVPGVDGVFVGPSDLAISDGGTLSAADPALLERIVNACNRASVAAGIYADADTVYSWLERGFRIVAIESDVAALVNGFATALAKARPDETASPPAPSSAPEHRA